VEMSEAKTAARPRVRKITKRSHQVLCFQREHEKGCSRRRTASFAISFSTASAVAEGADYEAIAFCFLFAYYLARLAHAAQMFAVPDLCRLCGLAAANAPLIHTALVV